MLKKDYFFKRYERVVKYCFHEVEFYLEVY